MGVHGYAGEATVVHLKVTQIVNWRRSCIVAGAVATLGFVVWASPLTSGLERFSYDLPFLLRTDIQTDEALVVFMDEQSRNRLKQPVGGPWDRTLHTRLLNELFSRHARVVVFDVLFDEAWTNKTVDQQFADAIKAHGHVVLGASWRDTDDWGKLTGGQLKHAAEPLGSAAPWGVAEFPVDPDGVVRRHPFDGPYTNLAWQAAATAGASLGDWSSRRWINYYGPRRAVPHVSYYQILETGVLGDDVVSNKIVFVGSAPIITYQGSCSSDTYRTCYTRWTGGEVPGVEIQATTCLNLLRHDWLARLPWPIELGLILFGIPSIGFLLPLLSSRRGLFFCACTSIGVAAGAIFIQQKEHVWFSWSAIAFVQIPALALTVVFSTAPQQKVTRQQIAKTGSATMPVPGSPPEIPDHTMLRSIGKGSYGEVWIAKNTLGTFRAVKIVARDSFEDDGPFAREFRGIQSFEPISRSHEGFVDVLHVGRNDECGCFYYVMELADDRKLGIHINPTTYASRTLESELRSHGRVSSEDVVRIGLVLSDALKELHRAGLVHRDIKPSNIIFVGGAPKLADIGLVTRATDAKSYVGTEGYMPRADFGSPEADIFALGMVLYEMATGSNYPGLPANPIDETELAAFQALNRIILKACEAHPGNRHKSAAELHDHLKRLANKFWKNKSMPF